MTEAAAPVSAVVQGLQQRSDREIAILRSAYHVMARQGSNRLNLQAIADEAGVSKGLVLYHFKSKSAVLQHAMEWALLQTEDRIRSALEEAADGDVLTSVLAAIFVSPRSNREFQLVYLDLIEASARDEQFAALPRVVRDIVEGLYAEVIAAGVERDQLAVDDVEEAALRMRVVVDGVLLQWLQRDDWRVSHDRMRALCFDVLRRELSV